jgi:hypothetical protein
MFQDPIQQEKNRQVAGGASQDIRLLMDADNIDLIMKDGVICKDTR